MSIPLIHQVLDLVGRVDAQYTAAKERRSAVDFEDLQVKARNLLRDNPDHARTHAALADYYERVGRTDEAARHRAWARPTN